MTTADNPTIPELSTEQAELLDRMANTRHKTFGTFRSVSEVYDQCRELVELGLFEEVTSEEEYQPVVKKVMENEDEELHVFTISEIGTRMFYRQFSRLIQ